MSLLFCDRFFSFKMFSYVPIVFSEEFVVCKCFLFFFKLILKIMTSETEQGMAFKARVAQAEPFK